MYFVGHDRWKRSIGRLAIHFLQRYGDHRHLHSFPTRRSSDLDLQDSYTTRALLTTIGSWRMKDLFWRWQRSEEHTSELQSRQYLVCRLLLEKKKVSGGRNAAAISS